MGCCSHVMSMLYLVSQDNVKEISKHLNNIFDSTTADEGDDSDYEDD